MTQETRHQPSGPLVLAAALAAAAGFVDAWVYLNVTPVFVANMSGNLIHLGMYVGRSDWSQALAAVVALAGFVVGVGAATWHLDRQVRAGREPHPSALLVLESVLLVVVLGLLEVSDIRFSATVRLGDLHVIVIAAFAMGLQAAALRRVGQIAVATTYGTGTVVRVGEKIVLGLRGTERVHDERRRATVIVLCAVLASYVGGAAVAALLGATPWWLVVPAVVLAVAASGVRVTGQTARD